jgi:hypothetical protein
MERRRMPRSMVNKPWPGRKSMIIPAIRRSIPKTLRSTSRTILPGLIPRLAVDGACNLRKHSLCSLATTSGKRIRLITNIAKDTPARSVMAEVTRGRSNRDLIIGNGHALDVGSPDVQDVGLI